MGGERRGQERVDERVKAESLTSAPLSYFSALIEPQVWGAEGSFPPLVWPGQASVNHWCVMCETSHIGFIQEADSTSTLTDIQQTVG